MKATLTLLGALALAFPAAAETRSAAYEFRWGGLLIGESEVELTLDGDRYMLSSTFRTRGLLSLFAKGQSLVTATGARLPDGSLAPAEYVSSGRFDGDDYRRRMVYGTDGKVTAIEEDWPAKWLKDDKREPVPEEMQTGPDPMSLLFAAMGGDALPGGIGEDKVWRTFDGRSVVDFKLRCLESTDEVPESRHSAISGAATLCGLTSEIVAGHPIETEKERRKREKREAKERAARDRGHDEEKDGILDEGDLKGLKLWLRRDDAAGLWMPIRARMRSSWGTVRMIMVERDAAADEKAVQPSR